MKPQPPDASSFLSRASTHHLPDGDQQLGPGARSRVARRKSRARYDAESIFAVIDAASYCHVAFTLDGEARILPTAHAREGRAIYLHGSRANAMLQAILRDRRCALAFTLLDGFVFARTALHHSMNYRSIVAFGQVREVTDEQEKRRALARLLDHTAPGRSREISEPTTEEVRSTLVVRACIEEASLKTRTGQAVDPEAALGDPSLYAGVLPLTTTASTPLRAPDLAPETRLSAAVAARAQQLGAQAVRDRLHRGYLLSSDPSRLDFDFVHRFLSQESYWARGVEPERLRAAMSRSLCFGVYRDGMQLGFGRAITDGARFAYLADIFVAASHRGQGLGKALVGFMLTHPELKDVSRVTLGTRDSQSLYDAFGFRPRDGIQAMVLER